MFSVLRTGYSRLHELSITQSILSIALEKAGEAEAKRISKINIVTGELSGIVDDCLEFHLDFLTKDTIAAGATLSFNHPPTQLRCRKCSRVFIPDDANWTCPDCEAQAVEIIGGRECYVESIEVE